MENTIQKSKTTTYHAFTIGPIFRTIIRARKTRELWAASYLFSFFMRSVLESFTPGEIILPYAGGAGQSTVSLPLSPHGAGIYPDRCILLLKDSSKATSRIQQAINNSFAKLEKQITPNNSILNQQFNALKVNLKDLLFLHTVEYDSSDNSGKNFVHQINQYLDNLELGSHYLPVEKVQLTELLELSIHQLYQQAAHAKSAVFIKMSDGSKRLLSVPEIALRELRFYPSFDSESTKNLVKTEVEDPISADVITMRSDGRKAKKIDTLQKDETLFKDLKKAINDHNNPGQEDQPKANFPALEFRHKYLAVVVADGDRVGKKITEISTSENRESNLNDFSKSLIDFNQAAIQKIVDYGGLPIYGGGDDLLFLAPVTNCYAPEAKQIMALCNQLNQDFNQKMGGDTSLSFGVSISYYKYPLGEAVANAYALEKRAKTKSKICFAADQSETTADKVKPRYEKQALCWEVRKHSGQQFGSTLWLGGKSEDELPSSRSLWLKLLEPGSTLEQSFLTSVMHKLQGLPTLLAHAAKTDNELSNLESFRTNHFNEVVQHEGEFIRTVFDLTEAIFRDYGDVLHKDIEKDLMKEKRFKDTTLPPLDLHHTNLLFSILRLKQFMTQPDHD